VSNDSKRNTAGFGQQKRSTSPKVSPSTAPQRGGAAVGPARPPQQTPPTMHDPQRTMSYSVNEIEGGNVQVNEVVANAEAQTIAPGTLKASEIFGPQAGASRPAPPPAAGSAGLQTLHTMVNDPAQLLAMAQATPQAASMAAASAAPGQVAAAMAMAAPPAQQRHPAVQRMPHEEVSHDVQAVKARLDDPLLVVHHEPDAEPAAAYRVLGHRLTKPNGARTVLVTSAEDGDGKSVCAANVALAMSEYGRAKVLLVEANLRAPTLAALLGFKPPKCFAQQLREHKKEPMGTWTIAQVSSWLHVMAVDGELFDTPEIIDALGIELAVEHFKRLPYDFILLDTPSVLGQADVPLMSDCADGIVVTAIARESNGGAIRKATQMLAPANILGIVLLEG
jgi:Mrp family chromosome partitioning ATPase